MNYSVGSAKVLKCNFCDYSEAYILFRDNITIIEPNLTQVAYRNCALWCSTMLYGALRWKCNRWCWRLRFGHPNL